MIETIDEQEFNTAQLKLDAVGANIEKIANVSIIDKLDDQKSKIETLEIENFDILQQIMEANERVRKLEEKCKV